MSELDRQTSSAELSVEVSVPASPVRLQTWGEDALRLLLSDNRSAQTKRAYAADLRDFFQGQGKEACPAAVEWLCGLPTGTLALELNEFKARMIARGLAESTINRRLAAVRGLLRMARRLGADVADPAGLVSSEKVNAYRDTRGPAVHDVIRLLAAPNRQTLAGMRDYALLVLLAENALRRAEVCACSVGDFDGSERRLRITGKGKGTQKEWITLSPVAIGAITAYLDTRAGSGNYLTSNNDNVAKDRPLLVGMSRRHKGAPVRLSPNGLYKILQGYGRRVLGRPLHPHGLRHAAITAALDATGGDLRTAQRLSRHADVRTLQRYDDNREDLQGRVTGLLSAMYQKGNAL